MLIDMIKNMLEISEIGTGVNLAEREPFDLGKLLVEACELFRPIAAAKRIELQACVPPALIVHGDRKRMQRVVTNLIDRNIFWKSRNSP